jgi:hypothetical protein
LKKPLRIIRSFASRIESPFALSRAASARISSLNVGLFRCHFRPMMWGSPADVANISIAAYTISFPM